MIKKNEGGEEGEGDGKERIERDTHHSYPKSYGGAVLDMATESGCGEKREVNVVENDGARGDGHEMLDKGTVDGETLNFS